MTRLSLLLPCLLLFGCDVPAPQPSGPDYHARGLWSWTLAEQSGAAPNVPDPPVPSDMCLNCKGRGKLGDGVVSVTCPVCNGTGKRVTDQPETKPEPVEEPKPEPTKPDAVKNSEQNYGRRRWFPRLFP